ncbi:MAG: hypothetical protein ACI808_002719, partial [Paraglaciecola sp.]
MTQTNNGQNTEKGFEKYPHMLKPLDLG